MTIHPLPHHRRLMRDPEASPLFRRSLIGIMTAGVIVLLWTGGVFEHLGGWLRGAPAEPTVGLMQRIVVPSNPLECAPSAQHRAVITIEQAPDGQVHAYCKRYLIALPRVRI